MFRYFSYYYCLISNRLKFLTFWYHNSKTFPCILQLQAVESQARAQGSNITWDPSGDLYVWQNRPACIYHPKTGIKTWFCQVVTSNASYYRMLPTMAEVPDDKLPTDTYYGDGSPIEPAVLQHVAASKWSCAVGFKWKKGDLLVLDNLAVMHGRVGFKGDRQLLVYMTE